MVSIIATALAILKQGQPLVEATVIRRQGSAPRAAGAKMIIKDSGLQEGTVGGGFLEAQVIEKAQNTLETQQSQIIAFDLTGADVADSTMICGGRTKVLIDFIKPDLVNIDQYERRLQALENKEPGYFLTVIQGSENHIHSTGHHLLGIKQVSEGSQSLPPDIMQELQLLSRKKETIDIVSGEDCFVVAEKLEIPKTAFFFGAGHVVLYAAAFADRVGFRVVVIDDREGFANPERYPHPAETIVIKDFKNAFTNLSIESSDFLIIATRGHIHDRTVLAQTLKSDAGYIGMIGSVRKRDMIYKALLSEGYTRKDLDRVYCPIGLAIGADTPEEIAVSIVAQMIQIRAGQTR